LKKLVPVMDLVERIVVLLVEIIEIMRTNRFVISMFMIGKEFKAVSN